MFLKVLYVITVIHCVVANLKIPKNYLGSDKINLTIKYDWNSIQRVKDGNSNWVTPKTNNKTIIVKIESCKRKRYNITAVLISNNKMLINNKIKIAAEPNVTKTSAHEIIEFIYDLNLKNYDCIKNVSFVINNSSLILGKFRNLTNRLVLGKLRPCGNYNIYISLNHKLGHFQIYNGSITINPGSVTNLTYNSTLQLITWSLDQRGNCSLKFDVTIKQNNTTVLKKTTSEKSINLNSKNISGCSKYNVSVKLTGQVGFKQAINRQIETIPNAPNSPTLIAKTYSSLEIKSETGNKNHCQIEMFQFMCYSIDGPSKPIDDENGKVNITNLTSNYIYHCNARVKNSVGWSLYSPNATFKTNQNLPSSSPPSIWCIVLVICITIVLITTSGGGVWYYKISKNRIVSSINSTYIEVKYFTDWYKLIDPDYVSSEFNSIGNIDISTLSRECAGQHNSKNRYLDMTPYDYNRVMITMNEYCTSNYINASYIDGYKHKDQYIATQGPIEKTCYDFWHMVVEKRCNKIVMLTQCRENNITKCFQYFPLDKVTLNFGDIFIRKIAETNFDNFIRRSLVVRKGLALRSVIHYQYVTWPDRGCPENELEIIEFIKFIKSKNNKSSNPIIVHCSAGVGRTGTLIALDILLQKLRNDKYISVYETVKKLRLQRYGMVQTICQYEFILAAINKFNLK